MKKEELNQIVKNLINQEIGIELNDEENLKESGVDSLSLVLIISNLEEYFLITFKDDDLDPSSFLTIKDLVNLVEKYL